MLKHKTATIMLVSVMASHSSFAEDSCDALFDNLAKQSSDSGRYMVIKHTTNYEAPPFWVGYTYLNFSYNTKLSNRAHTVYSGSGHRLIDTRVNSSNDQPFDKNQPDYITFDFGRFWLTAHFDGNGKVIFGPGSGWTVTINNNYGPLPLTCYSNNLAVAVGPSSIETFNFGLGAGIVN